MEDPLIKYIKECKNKNFSDEDIIKNLTTKGWPIEKINQAFLQMNTIQIPQNPAPSQPVSTIVSDQTATSQQTIMIYPLKKSQKLLI